MRKKRQLLLLMPFLPHNLTYKHRRTKFNRKHWVTSKGNNLTDKIFFLICFQIRSLHTRSVYKIRVWNVLLNNRLLRLHQYKPIRSFGSFFILYRKSTKSQLSPSITESWLAKGKGLWYSSFPEYSWIHLVLNKLKLW